MAAKIEWTAADYAAKNAMAKIIDDSALAYRVIAERMGGVVSHVRIGYIHNGEKSPVRLSEFLLICEVCNADPVQTLREIITEARHMELEQQTATTKKSAGERFVVDDEQARVAETLQKLKRGDMDIVALEDEHKFDGDGDDPA